MAHSGPTEQQQRLPVLFPVFLEPRNFDERRNLAAARCRKRWLFTSCYKTLRSSRRTLKRLVSAYEQTLRALRLKDRSDPITQLVAEKIIAIGRLGIEDPAQIYELVLKELTTR